MRKLNTLIFTIVAVSLMACGQNNVKKTPAAATPEAVVAAFTAKYPGATDVAWEQETVKDSTLYEAEFKLNDKRMEARFDDAGNFVDEK